MNNTGGEWEQKLHGNWPNCRNCIVKCPIRTYYKVISNSILASLNMLICSSLSLSLSLLVSLSVCVCAWRYSPQSNNIKVCVRLLWKWPQNAFGNRPCDALRHLSHKCAVRIHTHTHTYTSVLRVWVYIECFLIDQIHNPLTYTRTHTHTPRAACAHLMLC